VPGGLGPGAGAGAGSGRALQLPGAHNVPYTHPELLSAVLAEAAGRVPV
jgi:hypothetical protein